MSAAATQADALKTQRSIPKPTPRGANEPDVLIPSALILTRKQEEAMVNFFKRRLQTLQNDLGYMDYAATGYMQTLISTAAPLLAQGYGLPFIAKQHINHLIYNMEMEWRGPMYGGLWAESNVHIPLPRRYTQQNASRCSDHLLGSKPYFSCEPVRKSNAEAQEEADAFANKLNRWSQFKANKAGIDATLTQAIKLAFIQGQQAVKPYFERQVQNIYEWDYVAVDGRGKPITAQDGGYIRPRDKWIMTANQITGQEVLALAREANANAQAQATGRPGFAFTPKPPTLDWKRCHIPRQVITFEGAKLVNIPYTAFLYPLTAPSIPAADAGFQLYHETIINMVAKWAPIDAAEGLTAGQMRERVGRFLYEFSGSASDLDYRPDEPSNASLGENNTMLGRDSSEPGLTIAEGGGWYSPHEDGQLAHIFIVFDSVSGRPIFYDYTANIARWNNGAPATEIIRVNHVANRWHGISQVQNYYKVCEQIDLQYNRYNFAQTSAGRADMIRRNSFYNFDHVPDNARINLNSGELLELKDNVIASDALISHQFMNYKSGDVMNNLQLLMQVTTTMSGVTSPNDAAAAGLQSQETATGQNYIAQGGDELTGSFDKEIKPNMENALESFIKISADNLDSPDAYTFSEGDKTLHDTIDPDLFENIDLTVSLNMSHAKAEQIRQSYTLAMNEFERFYTKFTPEQQTALLPVAEKGITGAFDIANTKSALSAQPPPLLTNPSMTGEDPAAAAALPPPPPEVPL